LHKKGIELLCVTSIVIAIVLFSLGGSMYDKSDKPAYESNEHDEHIGFIIILVGYGFLCISVLLCCFLGIKHVRNSKNSQVLIQENQRSIQENVNYGAINFVSEKV
jgi:hypothetical protein